MLQDSPECPHIIIMKNDVNWWQTENEHVCRHNAIQLSSYVNSTPTNTARTELHSMITFHHAKTRGSRAAKLRIAHLCVPKTFVIHVSCYHSLPHLTLTTSTSSLTHFIHFSYLSDGATFADKPYDSRPIYTLRCSTAEWRINRNPISHIVCQRPRIRTLVISRTRKRRKWYGSLIDKPFGEAEVNSGEYYAGIHHQRTSGIQVLIVLKSKGGGRFSIHYNADPKFRGDVTHRGSQPAQYLQISSDTTTQTRTWMSTSLTQGDETYEARNS